MKALIKYRLHTSIITIKEKFVSSFSFRISQVEVEIYIYIYILFELKKYKGVAFHETEEECKIWRGIDFSFQNWHKEFDKF